MKLYVLVKYRKNVLAAFFFFFGGCSTQLSVTKYGRLVIMVLWCV